MADRLAFPLRGVSNKSAYLDGTAGFVPPQSLRNVRPHDVDGDRERFSPRAGMWRLSGQRLGPSVTSFVQGLANVSQASSITGYTYGDGQDITGGESLDGTTIINATDPTFLKFNGWVIAQDRGLRAKLNELGQADATFNDDIADEPTLGPKPCFACCWSPDGEYEYILSLFPIAAGSNPIIWSISKFDRDGESVAEFGSDLDIGLVGYSTWGDYPPAGGAIAGDSFPNHMVCDDEYVFVAAGKYIYVLNAEDGAHLQQLDLSDYATEVMALAIRPDGYLVACFAGAAGTIDVAVGNDALGLAPTDLGAGTDRDNGFYWRAGVALMTITPGLVETDSTVLALTQYGAKRTDTGAADYEDHPTFRISEKSVRIPGFGAIPNTLCVLPDNSVIVGRTNRGWGREDANKPLDTQPLVSIFKIGTGTTGASLEWERDVGSILEQTQWDTTTVRCDVPVLDDTAGISSPRTNITDDPHPTVDAIVGNSIDGVHFYCAGRRTGANFSNNVWKVRSVDGEVVDSTNISPTGEHWFNQNCAAFNELDNTVVLCGRRKNGATDTANLWILDGETLDVLHEQDLGYSVDAYGCAVSVNGEILYVTGKAELP